MKSRLPDCQRRLICRTAIVMGAVLSLDTTDSQEPLVHHHDMRMEWQWISTPQPTLKGQFPRWIAGLFRSFVSGVSHGVEISGLLMACILNMSGNPATRSVIHRAIAPTRSQCLPRHCPPLGRLQPRQQRHLQPPPQPPVRRQRLVPPQPCQ